MRAGSRPGFTVQISFSRRMEFLAGIGTDLCQISRRPARKGLAAAYMHDGENSATDDTYSIVLGRLVQLSGFWLHIAKGSSRLRRLKTLSSPIPRIAKS